MRVRTRDRSPIVAVVDKGDESPTRAAHSRRSASTPAADGLQGALVPTHKICVRPSIGLLQVGAVFNDARRWRDAKKRHDIHLFQSCRRALLRGRLPAQPIGLR